MTRRGAGHHVFVDETKHRGYVMAGVQVPVEEVGRARTAIRNLLLGSQTAVVVDASAASTQRAARAAAISHLVRLTAPAHLFILERDDSWVRTDQQVLYRAVRECDVEATQYRHLPKAAEPLLWTADAVAWCSVHSGWRERVAPMVMTWHRL